MMALLYMRDGIAQGRVRSLSCPSEASRNNVAPCVCEKRQEVEVYTNASLYIVRTSVCL